MAEKFAERAADFLAPHPMVPAAAHLVVVSVTTGA
jgi:hypothetical protein